LIDTSIPMSGWPPAWLAEALAANDSISPAAFAAGAAAASARQSAPIVIAIR
jgi:hypothetical protein